GRVLIRPAAPHLSIRNRFAPNLTSSHRRPMIGNRDIRQADPLRHTGPLADAWDVQFRRLASVSELRLGATRQKTQSCPCCEKSHNTLRYTAHNRTLLSDRLRPGQCAGVSGATPFRVDAVAPIP